MPRLAQDRDPAMPSTASQRERYDRMLSVAARHGRRLGLEQVNMAQIAEESGVAVGTLYRYFPTKHHLYAALLDSYVNSVDVPDADGDRVAAVTALMTGAIGALLSYPRLARAMIVSANARQASSTVFVSADLAESILATAGIAKPSDDDRQLALLLEQCAYGIITWAVTKSDPADGAIRDMTRACELLLAPWSNTPSKQR